KGQLLGEATYTFDLETVEQDKQEHAKRHTKGSVWIGGRNDLEVFQSHGVGHGRDKIHRNQLQDVHQQDPDENRQCQRCNQRVFAVEDVTNKALNEFEGYFNQILQTTRSSGRCASRRVTEQPQEQNAHGDGPAEGIHVECHETHVGGFLSRSCERPGSFVHNRTVRANVRFTIFQWLKLAIGEVGKVVFYILYWGISCHTALVQSSLWSRPDDPA